MSDTTGLVFARHFRDAPLLRPQLTHVIHARMTNPADDEVVVVGEIPKGALITRVEAYVSDAFAAGDEFNMGLWGEDNTVIDADSLIANSGVTTQTVGRYEPVTGIYTTTTQNVQVRAQYLADSDTPTAGVIDFAVHFAMADGRFAV